MGNKRSPCWPAVSVVETVYLRVASILLASSGLDERQEDGLPEIGQDIKPKMVLSCGIHSFSTRREVPCIWGLKIL